MENLIKTNQLKAEKFDQSEFDGLIKSGMSRLSDANNSTLSAESRFDLAYNAAHALALASLRFHGYRSQNRFIVFQVLPYTLGMGPEVWRVLAKCHDQRNRAEYEGYFEIDNQLLIELLTAAQVLLKETKKLNKKSQ